MKKLKFKILFIVSFAILQFICLTATAENFLIPCGTPVGIAVYSEGALVLGTKSVKGADGTQTNAKSVGIRTGDTIVGANNSIVTCIEDFSKIVSESESTIKLTVKRNGICFDTTISVVDTDNGKKAGILLRDSAAGIGTVTWYNPTDKSFAALGHGISDTETRQIFPIKDGDVFKCEITGALKGIRGTPGELNGRFENVVSGKVFKNTVCGIFGTIENTEILSEKNPLAVANDSQIHEGNATILCDADGGGVSEYEIQITKTDFNSSDGKNFILKITDKDLLKKTGGIVQGMSGAPIIQDNRLIGAVTHVFINNPQKGYGISISKMVSEN